MNREPLATPSLAIVIPAFNEADRLEPTLQRLDAYAAEYPAAVQLLLVDDGSSDGTAEIARNFQARHLDLRVLVNPANRGKGHSVRRGMLKADAEAILMCDADLSTPIEELDKLLPGLDEGYAVVIGSRAMPDSVLDPPQGWLRRAMNILFRLVRQAVILRDLRDTQCGFKCFRRDAARAVFERVSTDGFAFDVEALGRARRFGYRIREVGVLWRNNTDSRVHPFRDGLRIFWGLVRIRLRLGSLHRPVRAPVDTPPTAPEPTPSQQPNERA